MIWCPPGSAAARLTAPAARRAICRVLDCGLGLATSTTKLNSPPQGRSRSCGGLLGAGAQVGAPGVAGGRLAPADLGQDALAEPASLPQVRVAGQDELADAEGGVLLDEVGHLLVAAHQGRAGPAPDQAHAGPQVRVDLQVLGGAAVPVGGVQGP